MCKTVIRKQKKLFDNYKDAGFTSKRIKKNREK